MKDIEYELIQYAITKGYLEQEATDEEQMAYLKELDEYEEYFYKNILGLR